MSVYNAAQCLAPFLRFLPGEVRCRKRLWDFIDYSRSRVFPGRINLIQRRVPPSSRQHHLFECVNTPHAVIRLDPQNPPCHEPLLWRPFVAFAYPCHHRLCLVIGPISYKCHSYFHGSHSANVRINKDVIYRPPTVNLQTRARWCQGLVSGQASAARLKSSRAVSN